MSDKRQTPVIMTAEKILFFFALIAGITRVYSWPSLSNDRLFRDDNELRPRRDIRIPDNSDTHVDRKHDNVCDTEECQKVASSIVGNMNKSMDPCENFYQFTCGRWTENNPILPIGVQSSQLGMKQYLVDQRISEILEKEPDFTDIPPVKQAKKWYRSCLDTESLDAIGIKPIESILRPIGGWPISMRENEWKAEDYPWQMVESYYARLTARNVFYDVRAIKVDDDSEFGRIVLLTPQLLATARSPLLDDEKMYTNLVTNVVKLFAKRNGTAVSGLFAKNQILELVQFERNLLKLINGQSDDPFDFPAGPITFQGLIDWNKANVTTIDWVAGIQQLFNPLKIDIHSATPIIAPNFKYFGRIESLLRRTPSRTIVLLVEFATRTKEQIGYRHLLYTVLQKVNYIHWNFIATMLNHTTENLRNESFEFTKRHKWFEAEKRAPRWMECIKEMKMTYAAAYVFAKKYFTESTRSAALEMMSNIKIGLEADIDNSNEFDESFKSLAKEKLKNITIFIGRPKWYNNGTAVTNYYKELTIGTRYFDNVLSYMRFDGNRLLKGYVTSIRQYYDEYVNPITVNADYYAMYNSLNIPPVNFQPPLFTPGLPDNVNYGQAGFIAGHEFSHAFDTTGILFGTNGSLLTRNISQSYYQRARCFVEQFNRYFGVIEEPEDSKGTLRYDVLGNSVGSHLKTENIADTIGLRAVFDAYKNLKVKKGSDEPKLPGLEEFTGDQLFFISFSSLWCRSPEVLEFEKQRSILARQNMNPHGPANLRVIGAISNTHDFAKVFECPIGSPMNPRDKCNIF